MGTNEIFAKNLKFFVIRSGRTQSQCAADLGVSKGTFSDWVSGRSHPRMDRVQQIAEYFGISKSELLENGSRGLETEVARIIRTLNERPALKKLFYAASSLEEHDLNSLVGLLERLGGKK